ncbi:hypothetical protein LCGC14_0620120, partial [marine sediment metagenome]
MKKGDIVGKTTEDGDNLKARVNWIMEKEAAITYLSPESWVGGHAIVPTNDWTVLIEAAPSYQSTVASMTDDQLQS